MRRDRRIVAEELEKVVIPTDRMTDGLGRIVRMASLHPLNFELISSTMGRFVEVDQVQEDLATVIMTQVTTHSSKLDAERVCKSGLTENMLRVMLLKTHLPRLVVTLCVALFNINHRHRQNIRKLIEHGGLSTILTVMVQNMDQARVVHFALPVLSQIIIENDSMFAKAKDANALPVFLSMLKRHMDQPRFIIDFGQWGSASLIGTVFSAMRHFTNLGKCDENVDAMAYNTDADSITSPSAMWLVLRLMQRMRFVKERQMQIYGCALLVDLISGRRNVIDRFIHNGGVGVVVRVMRANKQNAAIQELGCQMFLEIAKSDASNRAIITTRESHVISAIANAMRFHIYEFKVQRGALNALNYILHIDTRAVSLAIAIGIENCIFIARSRHATIDDHVNGELFGVCDEILACMHIM
jgi:hypothetical protein